MREKKERKRWTGDEIVAVIRRHLVERVELSKVCEEAGCHPSQVFGWEKKFFEGGAKVFDRQPAETRETQKLRERAETLEQTLRRKDAVLAELMEEHVALKKTAGESSKGNGSRPTSAMPPLIS